MYCTNCGAKIDNGAVFCTSCGTKIEAPEEAAQTTQPEEQVCAPSLEQVSVPVMEPIVSSAPEDHSAAPKELRKPLDKKIVIGAIVAVVVIIAIVIGVFAVQKMSSAQGKWYAYDDYGTEYELTLSDNGTGYTDAGYSFTWEESKDAVTTDDGDVYEKTDGKLQQTGVGYAYFKSEADAKADYDSRIAEMRSKCDQLIEQVKAGFVGTWSYKDDSDKSTLVVNEDGTWSASSKYKVWSWFSSATKANHEGTWSVGEVDDVDLPEFEDMVAIDVIESTDSEYGDPIRSLNAYITTDENGNVVVDLGEGWTKTDDKADASKLKSSAEKDKAGEPADKDDTYTLSTTSITGKKLKGKVRTDADGYVIADSDTHEYTLSELKKLDLNDAELCVAWNEPFARKGHTFGNSALQEYFDHCSWYSAKGTVDSIQGAAAANNKKLKELLTDSSWKSLSSQKN